MATLLRSTAVAMRDRVHWQRLQETWRAHLHY